MNDSEYASGYTAINNPVRMRGGLLPGQGKSGYGSKIRTFSMVHFPGDPKNRFYRVYCVCWSNSGSLYIIRKGVKLWIREHELEEALGR